MAQMNVKASKSFEEKHVGKEPEPGSEVPDKIFSYAHYNYFYNLKDAYDFLLTYLKAKDPARYKKIKKISHNKIVTTSGWIARMLSRGCILQPNVLTWFENQLNQYETLADSIADVVDGGVSGSSVKESPTDKAVSDFEDHEDQFFRDGFKNIFSTQSYINNNNVSAQACKKLHDFYKNRLDEVKLAKTDPQVKEAYSCYSQPEKNKVISFYEKILSDIELTLNNKQRARKPRAAKQKSADVIVKSITLTQIDPTTKISTIPMVNMIGMSVAVFYNVKSRLLSIYEGENLTVKGKTIINFKTCKEKRIRKPEISLPLFAKTTKKGLMKIFDGLTTREGVGSGRINNDQMLLFTSK